MSLLARIRRLSMATAIAILPVTAFAQQSYAEHPEALAFARKMHAEHGFAQEEVIATLGQLNPDNRVIRLITPPKKSGRKRSWDRYRSQFIEPMRIEHGVEFWNENADTLARASERYGVPEEVIVSIIGVETIYGRNTGHFNVAEALATLAFDYPPRAELFRKELENLFLLAREQGRDPLIFEGSYAGAMGYPQFLPSSVRNYAVDFDGDGHIDLESSTADAIGSVANYLAAHGWEHGGPVAIRAHVESETAIKPLIDAGIDPVFSAEDFSAHAVLPLDDYPAEQRAALIDLETPGAATEYWLGFRNFYVITRYNRSSFYAMAVFGLSQALRNAHTETTVSAAAMR
ncbi:lytic murein transglycosylase B [Nitrogeniibacter aestuarii]|uniref:lytic murein transglycosylase B n=1 Tax=Nitrogeniibacter aestuarii TaxID=2815343 RepID=UPI001D11D1F6|nr:lytic murein transglycosylase B [Nitrogeniibacter aestuarii]